MIELVKKYPHRLTRLFLEKAAEVAGVEIESLDYSWHKAGTDKKDTPQTIKITLKPHVKYQNIYDFGLGLAPYECASSVTVFENHNTPTCFTIGNITSAHEYLTIDDTMDGLILSFYEALNLGKYFAIDPAQVTKVFDALNMSANDMEDCAKEHGGTALRIHGIF